jgi:hypothetical protein
MLTAMKHAPGQPEPGTVVPALALFVLAASGLVLASTWFVEYPVPVLAAAWAIAIAAATTVVASAWREARRHGLGYLRSIGASLRQLGRFVMDFF